MTDALLETTRPVLCFDQLRVPYRVVAEDGPLVRVRRPGGGPELVWPAAADDDEPEEWRLGETPLYARVRRHGEGDQVLGLVRADGETAAVLRAPDGSLLLPFDPDAAILALWSERYRAAAGAASPAKRLALKAYYRVRPLLPRALQLRLRRAFARVQARARFPRWPVEPALHDLYRLLHGWASEIAGEPLPWIAPWPHGREWAFVLTHDVETNVGYRSIGLMRELEERHGYRSSWNLVPRRAEPPLRYEVEDELVAGLEAAGFEVGVHGLHHDGRDLESRATLERRLPEMRAHAERWRAVGFRSPSTIRSWELMPLLGFEYDSSYPDTDPFEPQGGGCCSLWPFFNDGTVELPITLPQDHLLFLILGRDDETLWREKAEAVRARGGLALLIAHPDYMLGGRELGAYERLLERFEADETCWRALPREVAAWWRRRAESSLERRDGGWVVVGPAAGEARVTTAQPA